MCKSEYPPPPSKKKKKKKMQSCFLFPQKAEKTRNTNFKKTKQRDQVMQALEDFVDGNTQILVGHQRN